MSRDSKGKEVSRAPINLRVINEQEHNVNGKNEKLAGTQTTIGNTNSNNNAQQRSRNKPNNNLNNRRIVNNNRNSVQLTNHVTWKGYNGEVNGVVGMTHDNVYIIVIF